LDAELSRQERTCCGLGTCVLTEQSKEKSRNAASTLLERLRRLPFLKFISADLYFSERGCKRF
jgi:hypothetical protein